MKKRKGKTLFFYLDQYMGHLFSHPQHNIQVTEAKKNNRQSTMRKVLLWLSCKKKNKFSKYETRLCTN